MSKITGHCVNEDDKFLVVGGPCIYIEGKHMSKNQCRHGFWFSGPVEIKIKKLKELSHIVLECIEILEKGSSDK